MKADDLKLKQPKGEKCPNYGCDDFIPVKEHKKDLKND